MTPDTLLLRQVNPSWIQQGHISSQVFRPTSKDNKKLSVYDGDQISPEKSWEHYTKTLGYASAGVVAVSLTQCNGHGLRVRSDPHPFPEHVIIDFIGLSENQ